MRKLIGVSEAARRIRVSREAIFKRINRKQLRAIKVGDGKGMFLIDPADLKPKDKRFKKLGE